MVDGTANTVDYGAHKKGHAINTYAVHVREHREHLNIERINADLNEHTKDADPCKFLHIPTHRHPKMFEKEGRLHSIPSV